MPYSEPTVAICTTCKNSALTIGYSINSAIKLNYPKEKIVYILVDSESSDNTKEVASEILTQNNIKHVIINKKCSISEGRNVCLEVARKISVEYALFIDADVVILNPFLLREFLSLPMKNETVFFVDCKSKNFSDKKHMENFLRKIDYTKNRYTLEDAIWGATGLFFMKVNIFDIIKFQEDMNFFEDRYFGYELRKQGYKLKVLASDIPLAYDINIKKYSDIYIKMPIIDYLRAINKKSLALAYTNYKGDTLRSLVSFLKSIDGKRATFHTLYVGAIVVGLLYFALMKEIIGVVIMFLGFLTLALWTFNMRVKRCRDLKETFSCMFKYSIFGVYSFFSVQLFLIINRDNFKKIFLKKFSNIKEHPYDSKQNFEQ
ncbi:MAG: glycosyltransferase [Candidatus Methanosuratincola petrocarbonis]